MTKIARRTIEEEMASAAQEVERLDNEGAARAAWSAPNVAVEKRLRRLRDLDRQIAGLKGGK